MNINDLITSQDIIYDLLPLALLHVPAPKS